MNVNRAVLISLVAATCCIGSTAAFAALKRSARAPLLIYVRLAAPETCEVTIEGQAFTLPGGEESIVLALRDLRGEWRSASIIGDIDTPYRCFGHALYAAQRAGFRNVRYSSEAPA
jgi:hypothetical protein